MATSKVSDFFIPELATSYTELASLDKNAFFQSGVASSDPRVTKLMDASEGGVSISMPYFNALTQDEPNIGNDDNTQKSTPGKITGGYETAIKTPLNKSYSVMDLAKLAVGKDPMVAINNGITKYWNNVAEDRIIAAATGILADSVANHGSDLLYDISGESTNNTLGAQAMNTAAGMLGENLTDIKAICVHPVVFTNLRNKNVIQYYQEGNTRTLFKMYGDYIVFIDKNMPVEAIKGEGETITGYKYYSFMFGADAFVYNYGNPGVEYEISRDPASGNGMGEELLYTRRCDLVLPHGYKTTPASNAALSISVLKTATTWTRAWTERERIKFVAVKSLG